MEEKPSFEELVVQWKADRGRIPPGDDARILAYLDLFATIEMYGYNKFDVKRSSNFNSIVHHSHNPSARNGTKWGKNCERTLHLAIARYWPIPTAQADLTKIAQPIPTKIPHTDTKEIEYIGPTSEEMVNEAPQSEPVPRREFTEEEWAKIPTPEPMYDPELRKLLGFNDE